MTAKQPPPWRLMPPVPEKVEVPAEKLIPLVLPIESSEPGEVVPMPSQPLAFKASAPIEVVAYVVAEEVPM